MLRLALLVIALVGVVSANESSTTKVFRIKPENDEQLEFLRTFEENEDSGVSNRLYFLKSSMAIRIFEKFQNNILN